MKKTIKHKISAIVIFCFILMICGIGCNDSSNSQTSGSGSGQPTSSQSSQPASTGPESNDYADDDTATDDSQHVASWPYNLKNESRVKVPEGVFTEESKILARNLVVVYDDSGSMDGQRIIDARVAFSKFVNELLPAGSNLALVSLNNETINLKAATPEARSHFANVVNSIPADGRTPLSRAVADAFFMLTNQSFLQSGCGDYTILVITDGAANSESTLKNNIEYIVEKSPVKIFTIGFQLDSDHTLNQPGRTTYKTAANLEELIEGMKEGLAETESFDDIAFD